MFICRVQRSHAVAVAFLLVYSLVLILIIGGATGWFDSDDAIHFYLKNNENRWKKVETDVVKVYIHGVYTHYIKNCTHFFSRTLTASNQSFIFSNERHK